MLRNLFLSEMHRFANFSVIPQKIWIAAAKPVSARIVLGNFKFQVAIFWEIQSVHLLSQFPKAFLTAEGFEIQNSTVDSLTSIWIQIRTNGI
jgi:hypothetical protein